MTIWHTPIVYCVYSTSLEYAILVYVILFTTQAFTGTITPSYIQYNNVHALLQMCLFALPKPQNSVQDLLVKYRRLKTKKLNVKILYGNCLSFV